MRRSDAFHLVWLPGIKKKKIEPLFLDPSSAPPLISPCSWAQPHQQSDSSEAMGPPSTIILRWGHTTEWHAGNTREACVSGASAGSAESSDGRTALTSAFVRVKLDTAVKKGLEIEGKKQEHITIWPPRVDVGGCYVHVTPLLHTGNAFHLEC